MPERGGSPTQSGIYYQNSVTALYLGRMLRSRPGERVVASVRAEARESVDDTVATFADGGRDFVQAKETLPESGKWKKLWADFVAQRREASFDPERDRLILTTADFDAALLREISNRASGATSAAEWIDALNQDQRSKVIRIEKAASATTSDIYDVFVALTVDIKSADDLEADRVPLDIPQSTKSQIELFRLLRDRVLGNARYKVPFERLSLLASIKKEDDAAFALYPDADEAAIDTAARDVGNALREQKATFGSTAQHLARTVTVDVITWLGMPESSGTVSMLLGDAGCGKTVVLRDILLELENSGVTVVAVKADVQLSGVRTPDEMQRRLYLPESLSHVLTVVGRGDGPVVFLLWSSLGLLSMEHKRIWWHSLRCLSTLVRCGVAGFSAVELFEKRRR